MNGHLCQTNNIIPHVVQTTPTSPDIRFLGLGISTLTSVSVSTTSFQAHSAPEIPPTEIFLCYETIAIAALIYPDLGCCHLTWCCCMLQITAIPIPVSVICCAVYFLSVGAELDQFNQVSRRSALRTTSDSIVDLQFVSIPHHRRQPYKGPSLWPALVGAVHLSIV